MTDYVVISIVVIFTIVGIRSTMKHFKGQGGCCGGGSYKPRKKKLSHVRYKKIFYVDGMHCKHCKNRVEEVVNNIIGVAGSVNLKKGRMIVSYAEDIDDEMIISRIEWAGYSVTKIESK